MGLNLLPRKNRRLPDRPQQPRVAPRSINKTRLIDFISDALYGGKRFLMLYVIDDGIREVLSIVIDTSSPGGRVFSALKQITAWRGFRSTLLFDNGTKLIS